MESRRHGLRDHIRMLAPLFALIAGVFALRWILSTAGSPPWVVRITSVGVATAAAILLAVLWAHFRQFGGYASVVISSLLLNLWAEMLIVGAILFTIWSGHVNIYTAPEYSMTGPDPQHLRHIYAHLTFGIGIGTLTGAAGGSLLLLLLRLLLPPRREPQ